MTWQTPRSLKIVAMILLALLGIVIMVWRWLDQRQMGKLLRSAIVAADRGEARTASEQFDRLLRQDPLHATALLYRAQLAREFGDRDLALQCLRRVPDASEKEAGTARFVEGTLMLESQRSREAERLFLRAVELHPNYLQPRERLTNLYVTQLRGREVRRSLDAIRSIRALSLDELIVYAEALGTVMSPAEAIPKLKAFVDTDSGDLASQIALGAYLVLDDQLTEAEAFLRQGVQSFPENSGLVALLAETLVRTGNLTEAESLLGKWPANTESHPWLWRSHGIYLLATEQADQAAGYFQQALKATPEDLAVAYKLGQALERSGRHELAHRILQRTRLMEKLALAVFRLRVGDRQRLDKIISIVIEVSETLSSLGRNPESLAWAQLGLTWFPSDPKLLGLQKRLGHLSPPIKGSDWELPELAKALDSDPRAHVRQPISSHDPSTLTAHSSDVISPIRLVDCHESAHLDFRYVNGQSESKYLMETLGGGVAVLDYDNDGWPDIYFTQGGILPVDPATNPHFDRLFRNTGIGTFVDVTEHAGLGDRQYSQGCVAGDYDNDGDSDLVVANFGTNVIYRNNGDGTFTDVTHESGIRGEHWSTSLALADLDRDGNLDLYVATYVLEPWKVCRKPDGSLTTCSPANFVAEGDILYRNCGDGTWEDITATAGINVPEGKGLGIVTADFDDDGWPDIYVANDGTPNFLFRNLGVDKAGRLHFEEIGLSSGCAVNAEGVAQAGMGIACGDLDDDGRLDLYVTNFHQEYNTLYLNEGGMLFRDATRKARLVEPTKPMLGFGTQAIDFDLDGQLDLVVTNGHIDDFRFRGEPWKMPPQLFWNRGNLRFVDVSARAGEFFQGEYLGRGLASLDWNRDGRTDVVIVHQDRPAALLRNDTSPHGNALVLELHGRSSNRDAIGAKIKFSTGGRSSVREVSGGDGFFATNERRLTLGIGSKERIDSLEITWPSGTRQIWKEPPAPAVWIIVEGQLPVSRTLMFGP